MGRNQQARTKSLLAATAVVAIGTILYLSSQLDHTDFQFSRTHHEESSASLNSSFHSHTPEQSTASPHSIVPSTSSSTPVEPELVRPSTPVEPELVRPSTKLDPDEYYVGYMPYAGLTNQFYALQHAAYIALQLNRTLIVPALTSNKHNKGTTFQAWSEYFDLPRLAKETGLRLQEWADLKSMTEEEMHIGNEWAQGRRGAEESWNALAEDITCQVIRGYGALLGVDKTFARMFLLKVSFEQPPLPPPPAIAHTEAVVFISDLLERYRSSTDHALFLSHTFGLKGSHGVYPWEDIGQHLHFTPTINEFASRLVQDQVKRSNLETISPTPDTPTASLPLPLDSPRPYVAVHLRRDDIVNKCIDKKKGITPEAIAACTPSFDKYAAAVERAKVMIKAHFALDPIVIVTTDTKSEEDLLEIDRLGWHRVDHEGAKTEETLGIFGQAMVDAAILAHADAFVGTSASSMSQVAQSRQHSWHQRETYYPRS